MGYHSPVSRLDKAKKLITGLSPGEKAQVLQWVARSLSGAVPGVEATPGVCGGEPRIVRTRIPVWLLVQARRVGASEAALLECYPQLRAEDLVNAWAYAELHRDEIERHIQENEAA